MKSDIITRKKNSSFIKIVKSVYLKLRKLAEKEYNNQNYELSLKYIRTLGKYMYTYNLTYCDNRIEMLLKKISEKCIRINSYTKNKNSILFYDAWGVERRGLSFIYIKALVELGYRITYITGNLNKSEYSGIEELVLKSCGKVYVVSGSEEIKKAKRIAYIVRNEKPEYMFVHTLPNDVAINMVSYACENINQRYMINLTDHAFWIGTKSFDYYVEFRELGCVKSYKKRHIPKEKLMILPYYPINLDEKKFKGFSFSTEGKKMIYSGGATYKIDGSDKYLKIVSHILDNYEDTILYYTGEGENEEKIHEWINSNNYKDRFILQSEREDFIEVMKRCYFYLSTYPIAGGLMIQYAVKNGKIPITLSEAPEHLSEILINYPNDGEYITNDYERIIGLIDKLLKDESEVKKLEDGLKYMVISEKEFCEELKNCIIRHETKYDVNISKKDNFNYTKLSLDRVENDYELLINILNTYIQNLAKNKFVWLYFKKWLQKRR